MKPLKKLRLNMDWIKAEKIFLELDDISRDISPRTLKNLNMLIKERKFIYDK